MSEDRELLDAIREAASGIDSLARIGQIAHSRHTARLLHDAAWTLAEALVRTVAALDPQHDNPELRPLHTALRRYLDEVAT